MGRFLLPTEALSKTAYQALVTKTSLRASHFFLGMDRLTFAGGTQNRMARVWAPCLTNKQEWGHLGWTGADSREVQWWPQAAERRTERVGLGGVTPQSRTDSHHRKLRGRQVTSPLEEGLAHSKIIQRHLTGVVTSLTQEMFLTQRLWTHLPGEPHTLSRARGQGWHSAGLP